MRPKFFKQAILGSIRTKFLIWFLVLSILPLSLMGYVSYYFAKESLIEQGRNQLQQSVDIAYEVAEILNNKIEKGIMTKEQAQEEFRNQMIGPKADGKRELKSSFGLTKEDYIFAYDSSVTAVMHPALEGKSKKGVEVPEHIVQQKNGFYEYEWRNTENEPLRNKVVYMKYFAPWDWVIVNGSWEENFYASTNKLWGNVIITILLTTILIIIVSLLITGRLVKPILKLSNVMKRMGEGDFTQKVEVKTKDEVGILAENMNKAMDSISALIKQVAFSTEHVAASSQQLTASANETTKMAETLALSSEQINERLLNQDQNIQAVTSLMQELAASFEEVSASADEVNSKVAQTQQVSNEGMEFIQFLSEKMNEIVEAVHSSENRIQQLDSRSKEIGQIINLITDIAGQTNLLALNAAIEAARAGEAGRGFAIVADEVRKLAEQTSNAATNVKNNIESIQMETTETASQFSYVAKSVNEGLEQVEKTGDSFKTILNYIQNVAVQMNEVAVAINEMTMGTTNTVNEVTEISNISGDISQKGENLLTISEEQVATAQEITSSAESLANMSQELIELINRFKV
ncbi:methyl-accepting chemotaxis protein [Tepidibacillus marianensis]|uniref:methyl-accepting chemotaxis protein n=1 Tax=Tepidibacillus marianensis TaxID=3131995 RepID=UPI0030D4C7C4